MNYALADINTSVIEDSVIVENRETGDVHELNSVAGAILSGIKERKGFSVSIADLLADIKRQFDVEDISEDVLTADIQRTLDAFIEKGLVRLE